MIYDVIIVGGGPAGICCAHQLSGYGYRIALIEKSEYPRDKTCGDALSLDVVNQLEWLDPQIAEKFSYLENKLPSYGIKFISPGGHELDLPIIKDGVRKCGYTCERKDFDNFLFEQLHGRKDIDIFLNTNVQHVEVAQDHVTVKTDKSVFRSKIVVGADGAHSIVSRNTIQNPVLRDHLSAGLRQYYENVRGFNPENSIELHFLKELLPGYFWIFPLPGNKANVGLGMLSSSVSKKQMNLKAVFQKIIQEHPVIKERFAEARPLESVKGFGLPLGSKRRKLSGDRVILTGDAASLIDPFSGEGVGNAIRSGRVAAIIILKALEENDFSADSMKRYDKELYRRIWSELTISRQLQKLCNYPFIFDFLIKKAQRNPFIKNYLHDALANVHKRKFTTAPRFLFNLLFR